MLFTTRKYIIHYIDICAYRFEILPKYIYTKQNIFILRSIEPYFEISVFPENAD